MPPAPAWLARIPHILAALEQLDIPVLGRAEIELLFRLRRRQALRLMGPLTGLQAGRTGLVERTALLSWLEALNRKKPAVLEQARKQKLHAALAVHLETLVREAESRRTITPPPAAQRDHGWPPGVTARDGVLQIRYAGLEDLLGSILVLTEQAAENPERFAARLEAAAESETEAEP